MDDSLLNEMEAVLQILGSYLFMYLRVETFFHNGEATEQMIEDEPPCFFIFRAWKKFSSNRCELFCGNEGG